MDPLGPRLPKAIKTMVDHIKTVSWTLGGGIQPALFFSFFPHASLIDAAPTAQLRID